MADNERLVQLLEEEKELILKKAQARQKPSILERAGIFAKEQFPEIVEEAGGRTQGLIPEEISKVGTAIQRRVPRIFKPALELAGKAGRVAAGASIPGGITALEKPLIAARTAGAVIPGGRIPELAGLTARLGVQQIVPPKETPIPGFVAEAVGGIGTGLIRGGLRGISKLRKTAGGKVAAQQTLKELGDDIIDLKALKLQQTQAIGDKSLRIKDSISNTINKTTQTLKDKLPQLTGEAAETMQGKLITFFKEGSESYGKHIDDMIDKMSTVMKNRVTRQKVIDLIKKSIFESEDAFIKEGRGFQALQDLLEKYSKTAIPSISGPFKKIGKLLNVKDVITDLKNIKKLISPGARAGATRLTADDIPIEILRKNIGGLLENVTKGKFGKLNEAYSGFLDVVKTSNRVFKPFKGVLETKQGAGLLERIAKGTAKKSEKGLLTALERGKPGLAKGVGRVETEASQFVKSLKNRISTLTKRAKNVTVTQKKLTRNIADKIQNQITSKKMTIEEVSQVLSDAEKAEKFLRRLGFAAGTAALTSIPLLRKIFSGGVRVTE